MSDEICCRVSLSPMFLRATSLGPMVGAADPTGGPFYCLSSAVLSSLSAPEKKEHAPIRIARLCQGDSGAFCHRGHCALDDGLSLLPAHTGKMHEIQRHG